mgnify:CR=1 FL=1
MNKDKSLHKRRFLNKEGFHSTAAISIKIEDDKEHNYAYSEISISDCSRSITLTLEFDTKEEIDNSLYKLDAIMLTCLEAKQHILSNMDSYIKRIEEKEFKKNNKDKNEKV